MNNNKKYVYKMLAGDHFTKSVDKFEQTRTAIKIVDHPQYNHVTLENDIALIETDDAFQLNDYVIPACLPEPDETPFPFTPCTASGWGYASSLMRPDTLQTLKMPTHPQKTCETIHHPKPSLMSHFTHHMMCAGYLKGGKDTCKGDSGGPLTCPRTNSTEEGEVITGIISWGRSCGIDGTLPVFTRVESYMNWITHVISQPPTVNSDPCQFRGVVVSDKKGDVVKSPGFGQSYYEPNLHCTWRYDMSVYNPKSIEIVVEDFELEQAFGGVCTQDMLKIYVGKKLRSISRFILWKFDETENNIGRRQRPTEHKVRVHH